MTLNLAQLRHTVKSAKMAIVPNPAHPLGANDAYRQLKAAGWTSALELHPVERVPVLRLGTATIRRNRTGKSDWLLQLSPDFETMEVTGVSVAEITEAVRTRLAELEAEKPAPLSPAAVEAAALASEYPALAGRITAALALVEAGSLAARLARYGTEWQNLTRAGNWVCECPDATCRNPRFSGGVACKHALAGEIARRVEAERKQTAYRKLADKTQRREREQALPTSVDNRHSLSDYASPASYNQPADPLNRRGPGYNRAQFKVNYGGGR